MSVPDLFPSVGLYVLCGLVVAVAQLIYATMGFGSGLFSIALLAILLPDLAGTVATLLLLTFVTEVWVVCRAWRQAKVWLLLGLLPTTAIGMWLGTSMLVAGDVTWLKRALGVVVMAAAAWFLYGARRQAGENDSLAPASRSPARWTKALWSPLVGFASGALAGLFGTGGPPVIIFLKGYRLDKGAFRATLLWFFLLVSLIRGAGYVRAGLLTNNQDEPALWLLGPSLAGTLAGMYVHRRLSERRFATAVSVLLLILGALLVIGGGR
jgi:uncharacterized membrane protein YfcA